MPVDGVELVKEARLLLRAISHNLKESHVDVNEITSRLGDVAARIHTTADEPPKTQTRERFVPKRSGVKPREKGYTIISTQPGILVDISGGAYQQKRQRERNSLAFATDAARVSVASTQSQPVVVDVASCEEESKGTRDYEQLQDEFAPQTLLLLNGDWVRNTPDFEAFWRSVGSRGVVVEGLLTRIAELARRLGLRSFSVNGRKLAKVRARSGVVSVPLLRMLAADECPEIDTCLQSHAALLGRAMRWFLVILRHRDSIARRRAVRRIQGWWRWILRLRRLKEIDLRRRQNVWSVVRQAQVSDPEVLVFVVASPEELLRLSILISARVSALVFAGFTDMAAIGTFAEFLAQGGVDFAGRVSVVPVRRCGDLGMSLFSDLRAIRVARRIIGSRSAAVLPTAPGWFPDLQLAFDLGAGYMGAFSALTRDQELAVFEAAEVRTLARGDFAALRKRLKRGQFLQGGRVLNADAKVPGSTLVEALPSKIASFPGAVIELGPARMEVLGIFERTDMDCEFMVVPASCDVTREVRSVGAKLLAAGVRGFVTVELMAVREGASLQIIGLAIRLDSFAVGPFIAALLAAGEPRVVALASRLTHPGMGDGQRARRQLIDHGFGFDLQNRIGSRWLPGGLIAVAGCSQAEAVLRLRDVTEAVLRGCEKRAGLDGDSSLAAGVRSLRHYAKRLSGG